MEMTWNNMEKKEKLMWIKKAAEDQKRYEVGRTRAPCLHVNNGAGPEGPALVRPLSQSLNFQPVIGGGQGTSLLGDSWGILLLFRKHFETVLFMQ